MPVDVDGGRYCTLSDEVHPVAREAAALLRATAQKRDELQREQVVRDGFAGWLAQLVIDKLGGTDDLPAWVRRSADYYRQTYERAEAAEADNARLRACVKAAKRMSDHDDTSSFVAAMGEFDRLYAALPDAVRKECEP
jgi:hypothetical protein